MKQRLAIIKEKSEAKRRKTFHVTRRVSKVYKDVEMSTKESKETDSTPHLKVLFLGPSQSGKSTICGEILQHFGNYQKVEINKFMQLKKQFNSDTWSQYMLDINNEERKAGHSRELAKVCIE